MMIALSALRIEQAHAARLNIYLATKAKSFAAVVLGRGAHQSGVASSCCSADRHQDLFVDVESNTKFPTWDLGWLGPKSHRRNPGIKTVWFQETTNVCFITYCLKSSCSSTLQLAGGRKNISFICLENRICSKIRNCQHHHDPPYLMTTQVKVV